MALAFYFAPPSKMSTAQYDDCINRLKQAGAGHPPGRVYHAAFVSGDSVQVFDVWTSQDAFDQFGATLIPILQGMGVDPGQPAVATVHNVIMPPAPKKKAAPKKRAAARRQAPKKKAKAKGKAGRKKSKKR